MAAALACFAVACTDLAVIGESSACGSACGDGLVCKPDESRCVQCMDADDCGADAPLCSAVHECVQCLDAGDCGSDEMCRTGACVPRDRVDAGDDDDHEQHEEGSDDHDSESEMIETEPRDDASVSDASAEAEEEGAEDPGL